MVFRWIRSVAQAKGSAIHGPSVTKITKHIRERPYQRQRIHPAVCDASPHDLIWNYWINNYLMVTSRRRSTSYWNATAPV